MTVDLLTLRIIPGFPLLRVPVIWPLPEYTSHSIDITQARCSGALHGYNEPLHAYSGWLCAYSGWLHAYNVELHG